MTLAGMLSWVEPETDATQFSSEPLPEGLLSLLACMAQTEAGPASGLSQAMDVWMCRRV